MNEQSREIIKAFKPKNLWLQNQGFIMFYRTTSWLSFIEHVKCLYTGHDTWTFTLSSEELPLALET